MKPQMNPYHRLIKILLIGILTVIIAQCGCWKKENTIAQVGDAVLTESQVNALVPTLGSEEEHRIAVEKYVNEWVDLELLYQEAKRSNIEPTPFMEYELDRVRKTLLVNQFLKIQIDSFLVVSDKEINEYYKTKIRQFAAETNYYRFAGVKTSDGQNAQKLLRELKPNSDIITTAKIISEQFSIVSNGADFIPEYSLNPLLTSELLKDNGKKSNFTIAVNNEYYVIHPANIIRLGEPKPLDMVKQEIEQLLYFQKRHEKYEALLSRLRQSYSHEINLTVSSDTTKSAQGGNRAGK